MAAFDARVVVRRLTGGMDSVPFDREVRERSARRFAGAIDAVSLRELFNLTRLDALFTSEVIPLANVDLFEDGHLIRLADVQRKSGRTGVALIAERFHAGATVRVRDIDAIDARLGEFAGEVRRQFAAPAQINVYLTPPNRAGFPPHFDITDAFIIQCLGAKEWRIFDEYTSRIDLPLMTTDWEPDRFRPVGTPTEMTLAAGDVLYVPRGVMHAAYCTDVASLHLTVSVTSMTFVDMIAKELQRIAAQTITFRRRVPWRVDDDDPAAAEQIAKLTRECLSELASRIDVAAAIGAERDAICAEGRPGREQSNLSTALARLLERG